MDRKSLVAVAAKLARIGTSVFALTLAGFVCSPALADDAPATVTDTPAYAVQPMTLHLHISSDDGNARTRKLEHRLRMVRYAAQLVDGLVSSAGYRRYGRTCLPCIAFAKSPFSSKVIHTSLLAMPAEANPAIQPISHGGFAMLLAGGVVYDLVDAQIERHWSAQHRIMADTTEIALHAWGTSTWQQANESLAVEEQRAANCAQLWTSTAATHYANYHGAVAWCLSRYGDISSSATHLLPATLQGSPRR